jgi:hypothetical protein
MKVRCKVCDDLFSVEKIPPKGIFTCEACGEKEKRYERARFLRLRRKLLLDEIRTNEHGFFPKGTRLIGLEILLP